MLSALMELIWELLEMIKSPSNSLMPLSSKVLTPVATAMLPEKVLQVVKAKV